MTLLQYHLFITNCQIGKQELYYKELVIICNAWIIIKLWKQNNYPNNVDLTEKQIFDDDIISDTIKFK